MQSDSILSKILLTNPFKRGMIEWFVLFATGILGVFLSWHNFSFFPYTNILGGGLIIFSLLFHGWTEKDHKQAHEKTKDINKIVTTGVYSKIRHPLYLSIIIFNLGLALLFGVTITIPLTALTFIHWGATACFEEKYLQTTFQEDYSRYKKEVRWRMFPGIF